MSTGTSWDLESCVLVVARQPWGSWTLSIKRSVIFLFFYNVCIDAIRVSTGGLDFNTAQKVSVFGVFLVRIFPHSVWIWGDAEYLSVFSPNVGKYRPENILIGTLFTQCKFSCFCVNHVFWCFFPLIWFWYMTILQRII